MRKIYFAGRHSLLSLKQFPRTVERPRRGEFKGFHQQNKVRRTLIPSRADIIFARNCPEDTTDNDLARIRGLIDRVDDGSRLIINPQKDFHKFDSKDRAFEAWTCAGLQCPRFWALDTDHDDPEDVSCVDQLLSLLDVAPRILLRTNNDCASNGMHLIDRDTPQEQLHQIMQSLKARVAGLRKTRCDSRTFAVEFVDARDSDGYTTLVRAFVLLERVIGYFAVVSDRPHFLVSDMIPEDFDRWIQANKDLRKMVEDPKTESEIVRSVSAVGNNVGAVDLLVRDGTPIFLEVNPHWGGVPGPYSFGTEAFEKLLEKTEDHWSARTAQHCGQSECHRVLSSDVRVHCRLCRRS